MLPTKKYQHRILSCARSAPNVRKKGKAARMTDIHVEPTVKRVAQEYIDREISVTEHAASNAEQKDKHDATQYPIHNTDPHEIKNGPLLMTDEHGRRFFQSIYMDRARYSVCTVSPRLFEGLLTGLGW